MLGGAAFGYAFNRSSRDTAPAEDGGGGVSFAPTFERNGAATTVGFWRLRHASAHLKPRCEARPRNPREPSRERDIAARTTSRVARFAARHGAAERPAGG